MKNHTLLTINKLNVFAGDKKIIHDLSLTIQKGEVHAIMGPNGSGKSTLLYALMGHPVFKVSDNLKNSHSQILFDGKDIISLSTEERAKLGIFLALQSPIPIPGVTVTQILRTSLGGTNNPMTQKLKAGFNPVLTKNITIGGMSLSEFAKSIQQVAAKLSISKELLSRGIHDGFSGGERKKMEILEAIILKPKLALFDEIDTGLDVDALKTVATGISELKKLGTTILIVTHYQRILKYIIPDKVHILAQGKLLVTGDMRLAKDIDKKGYATYVDTISA